MKLAISAGLAVMCILITSAFAVPAGTYIHKGQDWSAVWLSGAGNYTRNSIGNGLSEFNRGVAGHIKLTTETHEGSKVSSGDLTLNGTSYRVFANMMPIRGGMQGHRCQRVIRGR